jgi:hypothetical protein
MPSPSMNRNPASPFLTMGPGQASPVSAVRAREPPSLEMAVPAASSSDRAGLPLADNLGVKVKADVHW